MKDICVKCGTKFEWMLDDAIIRYGCGNPKAIVPCPHCKKLNIVFVNNQFLFCIFCSVIICIFCPRDC